MCYRAIRARVHHCRELKLGPYLTLVAKPVLGEQPRRIGECEAGHPALLVAPAETAAEIATRRNVAKFGLGRRRFGCRRRQSSGRWRRVWRGRQGRRWAWLRFFWLFGFMAGVGVDVVVRRFLRNGVSRH